LFDTIADFLQIVHRQSIEIITCSIHISHKPQLAPITIFSQTMLIIKFLN